MRKFFVLTKTAICAALVSVSLMASHSALAGSGVRAGSATHSSTYTKAIGPVSNATVHAMMYGKGKSALEASMKVNTAFDAVVKAQRISYEHKSELKAKMLLKMVEHFNAHETLGSDPDNVVPYLLGMAANMSKDVQREVKTQGVTGLSRDARVEFTQFDLEKVNAVSAWSQPTVDPFTSAFFREALRQIDSVPMSEQRRKVMLELATGNEHPEIAKTLGISPLTVKDHVAAVRSTLKREMPSATLVDFFPQDRKYHFDFVNAEKP